MEQNMSIAKNKGVSVAPSNKGKENFDLADVSSGEALGAAMGGSTLAQPQTAEELAGKISASKSSGNSSIAGGKSVNLNRGF